MSALQQILASFGMVTSAWAIGATMPRGKYGHASIGTSTDALTAGGNNTTNYGYGNYCDRFNGTSWSAMASLVTGSREFTGGCGTTTAALVSGGLNSSETGGTETFNGTSWTSKTACPVKRGRHAVCGISTSALIIAGADYNWNLIAASQLFNGTTWATGGASVVPRLFLAACGVSSAALAVGGGYSAGELSSEMYNGTAWATSASMTKTTLAPGVCGSASSARAFGGFSPSYGSTYADISETFNGVAWAASSALLSVRKGAVGGHGSSGAATCTGGNGGSIYATTENYQ